MATPQTPPNEKNRVDQLFAVLSKEKRMGDLEAELLKMPREGFRPEEEEAWYQSLALAAYRRGDSALALSRFEDAFQRFPKSADIAFSLAQEYWSKGLAEGDDSLVDKAFSLWDQFEFPDHNANYTMFKARYAYLWGDTKRAARYLWPIMHAYARLGIVDDNFLYMRGLPFFGQIYEFLAVLYVPFENRLQEFQDSMETKWYPKLSEYDFDRLRLQLECVKTKNFTPMIESLETRIAEWRKQDWPTDFQETKLAVLKCQQQTSHDAAREELAKAPRQDPWLQNILLLAQCEAAKRFGHQELEQELINDFIKAQPLLLEPNEAYGFNLYEYQRTLRPHFKKAHRRS